MTHYREILRLTALGCSQREICASTSVSQKTVVKVQKRASELGMHWPLDDSVTDGILMQRLFPKEQAVSAKKMPDYEYLRKELLRNGVNKKLLWTEYLEDCKRAGDNPLMYSQYCHYIQIANVNDFFRSFGRTGIAFGQPTLGTSAGDTHANGEGSGSLAG